MKRSFAKIRGIGFMVWHARHMLYHKLLGFVWYQVVSSKFGFTGSRLLLLSLLGSVFPDMEHLIFFVTYGKHNMFSEQIRLYIKHGEWRILIRFMEIGHKYNTELRYHNLFTIIGLCLMTIGSMLFSFPSGVIFFGAMISHYLFDIVDDLATLGKINRNWFRWGRGKKLNNPHIWKSIQKTISRETHAKR